MLVDILAKLSSYYRPVNDSKSFACFGASDVATQVI
jgi:hypothetical protein